MQHDPGSSCLFVSRIPKTPAILMTARRPSSASSGPLSSGSSSSQSRRTMAVSRRVEPGGPTSVPSARSAADTQVGPPGPAFHSSIVPHQDIHFPLPGPGFGLRDETRSDRVSAHVLPLLGIAFAAPQLTVPAIALPQFAIFGVRPASGRDRFPVCDPLLHGWVLDDSRGAEHMDMVGHDDIPANDPLIRLRPGVFERGDTFASRQYGFTILCADGDMDDDRPVFERDHRHMGRSGPAWHRIHHGPVGGTGSVPSARPTRRSALQGRPFRGRGAFVCAGVFRFRLLCHDVHPLEGRAPSRPGGRHGGRPSSPRRVSTRRPRRSCRSTR